MPQWAGSSWYYIAYAVHESLKPQATISEQISNPVFQSAIQHWLPVDMYVGGTEHATRHLIYARFWHKFLFDCGVVHSKEPFLCLKNQGLILGEDGRKMSKRYGNVVNPDDVVERFGADTLRVYEMFMGPFEEGQAWSTDNMIGSRRFLEKVWRLAERVISKAGEVGLPGGSPTSEIAIKRILHQTIKKVTDDIELFKFNTAISQMMIAASAFEARGISRDDLRIFLIILAPFAPHISEELWSKLGGADLVYQASWPRHDENLLTEERLSLAIQVNGKLRDEMEVAQDLSEEEIITQALSREKIQLWMKGRSHQKTIYVKGKLVNIVVT